MDSEEESYEESVEEEEEQQEEESEEAESEEVEQEEEEESEEEEQQEQAQSEEAQSQEEEAESEKAQSEQASEQAQEQEEQQEEQEEQQEDQQEEESQEGEASQQDQQQAQEQDQQQEEQKDPQEKPQNSITQQVSVPTINQTSQISSRKDTSQYLKMDPNSDPYRRRSLADFGLSPSLLPPHRTQPSRTAIISLSPSPNSISISQLTTTQPPKLPDTSTGSDLIQSAISKHSIHRKVQNNDFLYKKRLLLQQYKQQFRATQEEYEKVHTENIQIAKECELLNTKADPDTISPQYLENLSIQLDLIKQSNIELKTHNEQFKAKLENEGPKVPPPEDIKASNKAFRFIQKKVGQYEETNKKLVEKCRKQERQLRKIKDDYDRAVQRLKGDQEIKLRFKILHDAIIQGEMLEEHLLYEIEELQQQIGEHRSNAQYDLEKLNTLIEETKHQLKQEQDAKWRLERNIKVKEQEIRNARLSSLQKNKNSKVAGKLVTEMELLGQVLSDKLTQLGSVENEIDNLQESLNLINSQIQALRQQLKDR